MAYDKDKLFEQAKKAIESNELVFIEEIIHSLPCSKQTFYDYFPIDSDELDTLKELLDKNKIDLKKELRGKWQKSDAPALQLSLYKLVANSDEIRALSMQSIDHTTKGESLNKPDLSKLSDDELRKLAELQSKSGIGKA
jgi:hypothetical protein